MIRKTSTAPERRKKSKRFEIGELAVYPAHGVGRIEAIESKMVNGQKHEFYILKVLENNMVIMIPTANVESVGLRSVINSSEIPDILDVIRKKRGASVDNTQTWNRRYRGFMDKIKTGSVFDVAEVMRDLYRLQVEKSLSFGEKKMLETARNLVVKEIAMARSKSEETTQAEIEQIFEKN